MRGFRFLSAVTFACCWWLMGISAASATTVLLRGSAEPLRGYLVSEDARGVTLRIPDERGGSQQRFIPAAEIDLIQKPVALERLEALRPDQPKAYRDYAEELAEKRIDPEARETSLRLYLMAAYLDPETLGKSCLLGMTALARSPAEERRFRALAYLLDAEHDRSLLKDDKPPPTPGSAASATSGAQKVLLRALEEIRQGNLPQAQTLLRRKGVQELLEPHTALLSWDELVKLTTERSRRGKPAPPELAAQLLELELRLLGAAPRPAPTGDAKAAEDAPQWAALDARQLAGRAAHLALASITEYSPAECVFRDGQWRVPD